MYEGYSFTFHFVSYISFFYGIVKNQKILLNAAEVLFLSGLCLQGRKYGFLVRSDVSFLNAGLSPEIVNGLNYWLSAPIEKANLSGVVAEQGGRGHNGKALFVNIVLREVTVLAAAAAAPEHISSRQLPVSIDTSMYPAPEVLILNFPPARTEDCSFVASSNAQY